MRTGELKFWSWRESADRLRGALDKVAELGLRWRGTRFDHYLQLMEDHALLTHEELLAQPGTRDMWEAVRQADQLQEATRLLPVLDAQVLVPKLQIVLAGPDLHLDGDRDDRPRNTLFELMVGTILLELGFTVRLTRDAEDLVASHPALTRKVSVECKRPAFCDSPDDVGARMVRNLVKLRAQLMTRDHRNFRMGVVGMDGLYRMRDHVANGPSQDAIANMLRGALAQAVQQIKAVNRARRLRLESSMDIGAVVLLGLGQDPTAAAYSLRLTRAFVFERNGDLERAMFGIFEGKE